MSKLWGRKLGQISFLLYYHSVLLNNQLIICSLMVNFYVLFCLLRHVTETCKFLERRSQFDCLLALQLNYLRHGTLNFDLYVSRIIMQMQHAVLPFFLYWFIFANIIMQVRKLHTLLVQISHPMFSLLMLARYAFSYVSSKSWCNQWVLIVIVLLYPVSLPFYTGILKHTFIDFCSLLS